MTNITKNILWKTFFITFTILTIIYFIPFESKILNKFQTLCQLLGVLIVFTHISWILAQVIHRYLQRERVSPSNRAVLVTGCDSGFGHQICYKLDSYGFHVFAGVLFPDGDGAHKLRTDCSERLTVVNLDVTKKDDVENVVKQIESSGLELWSVLNNAGISYFATIEMGNDVEVFDKIFAVNVLGLVRVTKQCLPLLRKSGGRVVNMSSYAGRFGIPGLAAYCMSKHAVRSFSDGLRREMSRFRVTVVTIEPNLYRTPIADANILAKSMENIWFKTNLNVREDYGGDKFCLKMKNNMINMCKYSRPHVHEVIEAQEKAITLCEPDIYYKCSGAGQKAGLWALDMISESAQDFILSGGVWKNILSTIRPK